jgi:hypothetical protein
MVSRFDSGTSLPTFRSLLVVGVLKEADVECGTYVGVSKPEIYTCEFLTPG